MRGEVGEVIGQYLLEEELGRGGMGVVYRAHDLRLSRPVALKVLYEHFRANGTGWARLLAEARMASRVNHPNVCTVYDVAEEEGRAYIAMELIEGRRLRSIIPGHGLAPEVATRYGVQIADALAHAHGKCVCHGDLTSNNVLLTLEDKVKVLDFGIAPGLSGRCCPSPETSAPLREDLRQFGLLLYEMVTGEWVAQAVGRPRPGRGVPDGLRSLCLSRLPENLRTVITRCLARNPRRAYQRAQQITADLEPVRTFVDLWLMSTPPLGEAATLTGGVLLLPAGRLETPRTVFSPRHPAFGVSPPPSKPPSASSCAREASQAGRRNGAVWANRKTKVYHCSGSPWFGRTARGEYMTPEKAQAAGFRPATGQFCQ